MVLHSPAKDPLVEVADKSDPGRDPDKQVNEDACGHAETPLGHLLVVCDGMGGHALGQEASRLALSTILRAISSAPAGSAARPTLAHAIAQAGSVVHRLGGPHASAGRPGSTCVAMLVHGGGCEVAHVGDSRAYLVRRDQIWQLTRDHSLVQQMIDAGKLTPEQAQGHPEANVITRALGMHAETDVELCDAPLPLEKGDFVVLATDGLTDLVSREEIQRTVASSSGPEAACDALVQLANARGGHDNITVLVARALVTTAPQAATLNETPAMTPILGGVQESKRIAPTIVDHALPRETMPGAAPAPLAAPLTKTEPITLHDQAEAARGVQRRGRMLLFSGLIAVAMILAGVAAWWVLSAR